MIFLWVQNERSFDSYHADAERIYRVTNVIDATSDNPLIWTSSPYPFVTAAGADVPEIEKTAFIATQTVSDMKIGNDIYAISESSIYAGKSWFEMFDYKLVDGSFEAFGDNPYSVILTESEAQKCFGGNAVGKVVSIDNKDYTVQAVVRDCPPNAGLRKEIFISAEALLTDPQEREKSKNWGQYAWLLFVKLHPDADAKATGEKLSAILAANKNSNAQCFLRPLKDIHFEEDVADLSFARGNRKAVSIFGVLGILILVMACINYVNLTTAKAGMKAKETAIRKIIGASRASLFARFMGESFVLSLASVLIALFLVLVCAPQYRLLTGSEISFSSGAVWAIAAITLVAVTLLNGVYPSLILSSFKPVGSAKSIVTHKIRNGALRRGLTIFQFTLSTVLTIGVIVIYRQMQYIQTMNPGYERAQIALVNMPWKNLFASGFNNAKSTVQSLKNELKRIPELDGVATCGQNITNLDNYMTGNADWAGRPENFNPTITFMSGDADYFKLMDLQLVEGRWFEEGNKADENNFILNETAAREFKLMQPYVGQRFKLNKEGIVAGIVKDFHFKSMHEPISPLVIQFTDDFSITFKTKAGNTDKALAAVREVWQKFFPGSALNYTFLDDEFDRIHKSDIRISHMMIIFCLLAVVIAALGLFALATFATERRTKEIGIRKVFGASTYLIVAMLTKEFVVLVAVAFAIAAPLAWIVMHKWLESFAYRISISVWILAAGGVLTLIIALLAVGVQAYRVIKNEELKIKNYAVHSRSFFIFNSIATFLMFHF